MAKRKDLHYWVTEGRKALAAGTAGAAALLAGGFIDGPAAKVVGAVVVFLAAAKVTHDVKNSESP